MTDIAPAERCCPQGAGLFRRMVDSDIFYSWRRSPITIVATVVATLLIAMAIFAPLIAPYDRQSGEPQPDGRVHPAQLRLDDGQLLSDGDRQPGPRVLSTIMYGSRISLFVGLLFATLFAMALGVCRSGLSRAKRRHARRGNHARGRHPAVVPGDSSSLFLIFGVARGIIPPSQQESAASGFSSSPSAWRMGAVRPHGPRCDDGREPQGLRGGSPASWASIRSRSSCAMSCRT